jgi:hypothetical protein
MEEEEEPNLKQRSASLCCTASNTAVRGISGVALASRLSIAS